MERKCPVVAAIIILIAMNAKSHAQPGEANSPDEIVPGIALDGQIVIDESIWVRLLGEPGEQMREAIRSLEQTRLAESADEIRKAAAFLQIAESNASQSVENELVRASDRLKDLADRVETDSKITLTDLREVFAAAHHALAKHHHGKSTKAWDTGRRQLTASYLASAANHLERAAEYSARQLHPDSKRAVARARELVEAVSCENEEATKNGGKVIQTLGVRIEELGKQMAK